MKYGYFLIENPKINNLTYITELYKKGAEEVLCDIKNWDHSTPQKDLLITKLKEGDTLLVYELHQFFFSIKELVKYLEAFQKRNIKLMSICEEINSRGNYNLLKGIDILSNTDFKMISKHGSKPRNPRKKSRFQNARPETIDFAKAVKRLRKSGKSPSEVQQMLDITESAYHRYLQIAKYNGM